MNRFEIEDGRSATGVIEGRRLGEVRELPRQLTLAEVLRKANSNRKHLRLPGAEGQLVRRLAEALDSVEELTFAERRSVLLIDADVLIPNGTYRISRLLGMGDSAREAAREVVERDERKYLFDRARELAAGDREAK